MVRVGPGRIGFRAEQGRAGGAGGAALGRLRRRVGRWPCRILVERGRGER